MQLLIDLFGAVSPVLLLYAVAGILSPLSMLSQLGKRRRS